MTNIQDELQKDIEAVRQIPIVPTMLEVICQITGMGFAAVARVTNNRWVACRVRDEVSFGLKEGGELPIETTLCDEIRDSNKPIVIDNVSEDSCFKDHHTPKIYGLQSYISFPIILKNGTFFGTLCAIDSKPADVNNKKILETFTMFADLLAFHLQSLDMLERSQSVNLELSNQNRSLSNVNFDLNNFVYTASHDLKTPLLNIKGLVDLLSKSTAKEEIDRKQVNKIIEMMKTSLQRFTVTIKDLTTFIEVDKDLSAGTSESVNVMEVLDDVKQDLNDLIVKSNAKIEVSCEGVSNVNFSKKNLKSIVYNLLSNSIKYSSPERAPVVWVKMQQEDGKIQISVKDNGLGIPSDKKDKVFAMSKRLHNHVEGSGIGLFIVKRIVDKNNGKILVDSTLDKGTTFTVII